MRQKALRPLIASLLGVAVLCVVVFSLVTAYMSRQGTQTLQEIGEEYMSTLTRQAAAHLGATMELRLSQVSAMAREYENYPTPDASLQLITSAKARGFAYLSLYQSNGEFHNMYGGSLTPTDSQSFRESMEEGRHRITMGEDSDGNDVILMGVPGQFSNGRVKGIAFVAGLPAEYIGESLQAELDTGSVDYYTIIRPNGSFVIRGNRKMPQATYFDRVQAVYEVDDPGEYVDQLARAMEQGADYSAQIGVAGEERYVYCTRMPYSEWYLLLTTPCSNLNTGVEQLSNAWRITAFGGCAVILAVLLFVFAWYVALTGHRLKALEEARQAAELASRAKSQFLSNMSHDIRTPMNGIVGMTAIASANLDDPRQVESCLKKITLSSRHLLELINDILDMARIDSGKLSLSCEQVSLPELFEELAAIVQQQIKLKNQSFDIYVRDIAAEQVCCDGVRFNQIFLNLVSNAIKFTPEGGSIQVGLYGEPCPKDGYVRVRLWVRDNGIGMTQEFQKRMFESFVREDSARVEKAPGAGVGMAITKHIVDAMEGSIQVQSAPGEGTQVDVILDLEKAPVCQEDMTLPDWPMLVVDDDTLLCESAAATLSELGIQADTAQTAGQALELAQARQKEGEGYQVFLVGWQLPDQDGVAAAEQLRALCGPEACILLTTAYDIDDLRAAAAGTSVNGVIGKPLFKSVLYYGLLQYKAAQTVRPAGQDTADLAGRRVLVAEDNDLNWEIAEELLSHLGMQLDRAENGRLCVEQFEASPLDWYDAILMDLRMPEMTGYQAAEAIRALARPDGAVVPIVAMSADVFPEDVQRCLDCGMNAHTAKPIDVRAVSLLLHKYISARPASGGEQANP